MKFTVSKDKHLRTDLKFTCRLSVEEIAQMLVLRLGLFYKHDDSEDSNDPDFIKNKFLNLFRKIKLKDIKKECENHILDHGRWVSGERLEDLGYLTESVTYEELIPEVVTILKKRLKLTY